jgi:exodeoxyribonuclease V gamma subunit
MARSSRPGDPSARQDDRYSFLETLLSAREKLSISYVGRSAVHNKEIPPSVVVSELLDYLDQAFAFPGEQKAKEFATTEHPLHAFSPRYFSSADREAPLFSYSEANAEASRSITAMGAREMPPFIKEPLPRSEEQSRDLELRELIDFWRNPSQYFVRRRLGLTLREADSCLSDQEPFQPTPLEMYPVKQDLLTEELEGKEPLPLEVFQARGILSPGSIGALQLRSMRANVQKLAEVVRSQIDGRKKDEPLGVYLELGVFTLSGKINSLYGGQSVHFRPANLNPKDYLRAWIEHLVLCAQSEDKETSTVLIGRNAIVTFKPVPSARPELQSLCTEFWNGLTLPPPFFPASAMAFVEAEIKGIDKPYNKAREKWYGPWRDKGKREGEKDNLFIARCFDLSDPFDEKFTAIARTVFNPMLEHSSREEL